MDSTVRDDIFPGLHVKIKTHDDKIIDGVVKEVLTMISIDYDGICVKLESGEIGNIIEIILTDSIQINLNLISKLKKDLKFEEGQYLEFKESFAYPTKTQDPQNVKSNKNLKMIVGKSIQAFANAFGGTLYVGIHDKTHDSVGLDRDFSLLKEGKTGQ